MDPTTLELFKQLASSGPFAILFGYTFNQVMIAWKTDRAWRDALTPTLVTLNANQAQQMLILQALNQTVTELKDTIETSGFRK